MRYNRIVLSLIEFDWICRIDLKRFELSLIGFLKAFLDEFRINFLSRH